MHTNLIINKNKYAYLSAPSLSCTSLTIVQKGCENGETQQKK